MTWSIIGTPASYDNGGALWGTTNFTWPTTASGDLAVVVVSYYENTGNNVWGTPSGFTSQVDSVVSGSGGTESRLRVYTKVCDGTETGNLTVARSSGTAYATALFAVLRGASALSVAAAASVTSADATSPISASTVTASSDEGILYALADDSGVAFTEDANVTVVKEGNANGTNSAGLYYEDLSATGTTTARSFSWSGSSTFIAATLRIAGVGFSGGGSASIPIDQGSVVITTYEPSVSQQSGSVLIPIDAGSVAYTTYDLTIAFDQNHNRFPDQGELTLSTYAESLSFGFGIPTSVDPAESFPDDSAMGITGYAPVVNQKYFLPMSVGSATFTTYDLSVSVISGGTFIDVPVGAITTSGHAPDDINAHVPSPTTGTVTFTGYAPTVDVTHVRAIGVGAVTTTTYDLSVSADTNTAILMDVGAGTFTGSAPSLSLGIGRHPGAGSITFTSYTPDAISEDVSWEFFPDEGSATYSTYDLTLSIIEVNKSIPIAVGSLVIPGWKPPFGSNPSVEVGARKRRKILGFLK